jgi:outer membrane protein OmpA-like peptidoglycan-associated protein
VPAAASELATITRHALHGQGAPAPATVRFPPNQAHLGPAALAELNRLASELTRTYPNAQASILAFGDQHGIPGHQELISVQRAMAVRAFLEAHGVAASRLFAAGYGTDLADPRSGPAGTPAPDRSAIVIIDPVN